MSYYFYEHSPDEWDFAQAVESKSKEKKFNSYQQLFDSLRNNLKQFDNETATNWKKNWNNITRDFLLKMHPTPSESIFHNSTVNFETVNSSTITNNINNEDAHNVTKRKNSDDIAEDLSTKKQKNLETSSEVPLEENIASSQESQESQISLYTNDTDSTERMSPYYIVNENNISRMCFDYRNECLKDELNYKNLPDIKKMAINHVYLIDQDTTASAFYIPSSFFSQLNLNESYPSLTREDINTITLINQVRVEK